LVLLWSCREEKLILKYSDGNGNLYIISDNLVEYIPVEPAESSSGLYSGGEYAKKIIQQSSYDEIKSLFIDAIRDTSNHITERVKTSGFIEIIKNDKSISAVLNPDSDKKRRIESLLKEITGQ
jgi:hypothetical protein